ncbi:hypothetical protein LINGRAHAP2_LOCUS9626 [Linum grandiflorum]
MRRCKRVIAWQPSYPKSGSDNKVQKSWFHGQDFHEYDPREIEYSAAVAAAAFAISLTEEAEADPAMKIKLESQRSMARVKSFKEGPLTRLGSFRSLPIKEDTIQCRVRIKFCKERIKVTRQVISDAKERFDNQLKIQKLKDIIFAVNEQLTKAKTKKQSAFVSWTRSGTLRWSTSTRT